VTETVLAMETSSGAAKGGYGCARPGPMIAGATMMISVAPSALKGKGIGTPPRQPPRFWSRANVNSINVTVSRFQPEWLTERSFHQCGERRKSGVTTCRWRCLWLRHEPPPKPEGSAAESATAAQIAATQISNANS
jgi:hypothetical protein